MYTYKHIYMLKKRYFVCGWSVSVVQDRLRRINLNRETTATTQTTRTT